MKTHREIEGYVFMTNMTSKYNKETLMGSPFINMEEALDAAMFNHPHIPIEDYHIERNTVLGNGWSVYVLAKYTDYITDWTAGIRIMIEAMIKAHEDR